jgi:hypothetical protein
MRDLGMSLADLSSWLCVDQADVAYTISDIYRIDLHEDNVPIHLCGHLKNYFEPCGERTSEQRIF